MTPYYSDDRVTLYLADAMDVVPLIADGSVDAVVTDPPYNVSSRNSRKSTTAGRVARNKRAIGSTAYSEAGAYREVRRDFGSWDHDWEPEPFVAEAARVLRPGGSLLAFVTEWTEAAFLASGLDHRCEVYWHKPNPAPNFAGLYQRAIEVIAWQTKGGGWTFNGSGATQNYYRFPIVDSAARVHPTQKPEALMRALLATHTDPGQLILDPYMGSGTTIAAAKALGRRAVGIEADERWLEHAAIRCSQEVLGLSA